AVEHVGKALDPAVVVLDVAGGGEELVLAYDDPVSGREVQRGDVPGRIAAEGDLAVGLGLEQQQRHPAEGTALEALLERVQADLELRVLPQQDVVLEVDGDIAVERHVEHGDQLALEAVAQAGSAALADLGGKDGWCGRHRLSWVGDGQASSRAPACGRDGIAPAIIGVCDPSTSPATGTPTPIRSPRRSATRSSRAGWIP